MEFEYKKIYHSYSFKNEVFTNDRGGDDICSICYETRGYILYCCKQIMCVECIEQMLATNKNSCAFCCRDITRYCCYRYKVKYHYSFKNTYAYLIYQYSKTIYMKLKNIKISYHN